MRSIILILCLVLVSPCAMAAIIEGNIKGDVTLTFVYDYQCSYCHQQYFLVEELLDNYPNLKIELMPVGIIGLQSLPLAAEAIVSTQTLGLFNTFTALVMGQSPQALNASDILRSLPVEPQHFLSIMHTQAVAEQLTEGLTVMKKYHSNAVPLIIISQRSKPNQVVILQGLQSSEELNQAIVQTQVNGKHREGEK